MLHVHLFSLCGRPGGGGTQTPPQAFLARSRSQGHPPPPQDLRPAAPALRNAPGAFGHPTPLFYVKAEAASNEMHNSAPLPVTAFGTRLRSLMERRRLSPWRCALPPPRAGASARGGASPSAGSLHSALFETPPPGRSLRCGDSRAHPWALMCLLWTCLHVVPGGQPRTRSLAFMFMLLPPLPWVGSAEHPQGTGNSLRCPRVPWAPQRGRERWVGSGVGLLLLSAAIPGSPCPPHVLLYEPLAQRGSRPGDVVNLCGCPGLPSPWAKCLL